MSTNCPNTHLFSAFFADGRRIDQNESDLSVRFEGKNCYYEVMQHEAESPLVSFVLAGPIDYDALREVRPQTVTTYGIDLTTGHFEVNKVPFYPYEAFTRKLKEFKLFYYRDMQAKRELQIRNNQVIGHRDSLDLFGYTLGYDATDTATGKRVRCVMKI